MAASALPVFCCTRPMVCPRQSTSPSRSATMSQARNPVDNASKVIAASRALMTPDAHARTTSSWSASAKTGRIAWDRLMPARFSAVTRSARPVNVRNGRKFDTTEDSDDLAWCHLKLWHIQFNILNRETLLAAQRDPEKYRDLIARIAGYSAYFVDLSPGEQAEIIARTEGIAGPNGARSAAGHAPGNGRRGTRGIPYFVRSLAPASPCGRCQPWQSRLGCWMRGSQTLDQPGRPKASSMIARSGASDSSVGGAKSASSYFWPRYSYLA
jgi:hypothetical protein